MLEKLKARADQRSQEDREVIDVTVSGMLTLENLQSKLVSLQDKIDLENNNRFGCEQIVSVLEKNTPNTEKYLAEVQQYVALAKQQLVDLVQYRKKSKEEVEKHEKVSNMKRFICYSS
jgi:hypothetical protein